MKRITLLFLLLIPGFYAFATKWTVVNSGFAFNPNTLVIQEGDTVIFQIAGIHNVVEVSQNTWNNNGNNPLAGGFDLPFGGGTLLPGDLPVGMHFYVCSPHAGQGMKGTILVQPTTATKDHPLASAFNVYPNPTPGPLYVCLPDLSNTSGYTIDILDGNGRNVLTEYHGRGSTSESIDLARLEKGVYFIRFRDSRGIISRPVILQ